MLSNRRNLADEILTIIADVVRRRDKGESITDESILAANPNIPADALKLALERLRRIAAAQDNSVGDEPYVHVASDDLAKTEVFVGDADGNGHERDILPVSISRFRPVSKLGEGSYGVVYKAYDPELRSHVALKLSKHALLTSEQKEFFFREARIASQLDHAGIVPIKEAGSDGDRFYITYTFVEGETLEKVLRRGRLSISESLELMIRICEAVDFAHSRGIIHRDLKPANIIIDGSTKQPRLMDFGLAKWSEGERTMTQHGDRRGTLLYMSPEQARGEAFDAKPEMDIYALGVILYELLTGARPFEDAQKPFARYEFEARLHKDDPESPRKRNPDVSKDLETITLICLSKSPKDRFRHKKVSTSHPTIVESPQNQQIPREYSAGLRKLRSISSDGEIRESNTAILETEKVLQNENHVELGPARILGEQLTRCLRGEPIDYRRMGRIEYAFRWAKRNRMLSGLLLTSCLLFSTIFIAGVREIYTQRRAKAQLRENLLQLNDNLLRTAELYGRRGEWQEALDQIEQAENLGNFDPIRVDIARIKALQALNRIEESRARLNELYSMPDLANYRAEATFLQGMSLLTQAEHTKGFAMLREAQKMQGLSPSQQALIEALTASDSLSGLKCFEKSLELDAFSQEAHGFLVFAHAMLGNDAEALLRSRIAMLLFPNDPNFPLLAAYVEGRCGNLKIADRYLDLPACKQLAPELITQYRKIIHGLPVLATATVHMWDFGVSREDFEQIQKESAVAEVISTAIEEIGKYSSADSKMNQAFSVLDAKGPECYEIAFRPLQELASLRTVGYLINGKGDTKRIDGLIKSLKRSADMHPDSMFDYCRGRLLFERDQSAAATEAFKDASRHHSMFGGFSDLGCFAVARCEYERFRNKEITSLAQAIDFANQRLLRGNISTTHAKMLLQIALAGADYELARKLVPMCGAKTIEGEPVELKMADIELADGNYLEVVRILEEQSVPEKFKERANEILLTAKAKLLEIAKPSSK